MKPDASDYLYPPPRHIEFLPETISCLGQWNVTGVLLPPWLRDRLGGSRQGNVATLAVREVMPDFSQLAEPYVADQGYPCHSYAIDNTTTKQ